MRSILLTWFILCSIAPAVHAQKDTSKVPELSAAQLEALFSDLDAFLDSLIRPRSFVAASVTAGNRTIQELGSNGKIRNTGTMLLSPAAGYYHKSGFGIGGSAAVLLQNGRPDPYQYLATFSYDYLLQRNLAAGIAFTRFFTEESLNFYTSPLQNEVAGYFIYRDSWFKPSLSVSYGWGSETHVDVQESWFTKLKRKKKNNRGNRGNQNGVVTRTVTTEDYSDWAVSLSVRHDFYKLRLLTKKDHVRFTPQLTMNAGTQQYGFNQTTQTAWRKNSGVLKPFISDKVALDERSQFQPLSLTAFLRTAYSTGKWYLQPQMVVDYYLPDTDHPWTTSFMVAAGVIF